MVVLSKDIECVWITREKISFGWTTDGEKEMSPTRISGGEVQSTDDEQIQRTRARERERERRTNERFIFIDRISIPFSDIFDRHFIEERNRTDERYSQENIFFIFGRHKDTFPGGRVSASASIQFESSSSSSALEFNFPVDRRRRKSQRKQINGGDGDGDGHGHGRRDTQTKR